jgi:predicted transcriptional regulator
MGPYKTISDKVLNSEKVKLISSVFYPFHLDVLRNSKSSGLKVDLIVTNDVCDILLNDYKEDFSKINPSEVNLWKIDDHLKLSFSLADEFMALGLFLDNGVYDSNRFLISEGKEAVSWGNKLFNHYLSQATEFKL